MAVGGKSLQFNQKYSHYNDWNYIIYNYNITIYVSIVLYIQLLFCHIKVWMTVESIYLQIVKEV